MGSQGDEGWPLGLPPVTFRMRLVDAFTAAGGGGGDANSLVLTATPSFSSLSSSDLDTESTMSFFPESKSITLGSLIGIAGAAAAADYPSFRRSLSSVTTSKTGSRRGGGLSSRLPRRSDSAAKLWSLIRCGTCRCAYYADDNSSIGAPPSLGHFLEAEREAEIRSDNDAKVYINIMYEESVGDYIAPEAINPLFDSVASPAAQILQGSCSSSAAELPAIAEEDPETPMSRISGRRRELLSLADSMQSMHNDGRRRFKEEEEAGSRSMQFMHNDGLFRVHTAVAEESRSMQCMRNNGLSRIVAAAGPRSRRKHRRSHSGDGVCVLNCVSYIWSFSKGRNVKDDGNRDTDTSYSRRERKCCPNIEISASDADLENGISYTNCSFDECNFASFQGGACICSTVESNSGLKETDLDSIDALEAEICDRQGVNYGHLDSNFGQKQAKCEQGQLERVNSGQLDSNYGQKEGKDGQVESISGNEEASNGQVGSHSDRQELIDGELSSNCGQEEVINGELSRNCGQKEVIRGYSSCN